MASLFGITPQDLLRKIVPATGNGASVFSIGEAGPPTNDMSNADALALIEQQEAIVESYMRHRYQRLLRRVEGEIAVRFAVEGQTTCRASLTPVSNLRVFKNFPRHRSWQDRRPNEAMSASGYTLNAVSGEITFVEPLRADDRVWLEYDHGGAASLLDLRHLVLSLAAVEVARRFAYFRSADGFERFEGWQTSAAGHLRDLGRNDGVQIGIFDRIELVAETRGVNLGAVL